MASLGGKVQVTSRTGIDSKAECPRSDLGWFFRLQNHVENQESCPDRDGRIRDIEGRKVPLCIMNADEVDHMA